ncbi:hypothetical protein [Peribacillus kribbensis]|uniref:hypothetical protein n=1 Tax=Peribacillus kribbensis TaxID=356658 RepID=UPI0004186A5C|nr:hypothetical protein [Peribacillus kribbensis]
MLSAASYSQLRDVQIAIEDFNNKKPSAFQQLLNIIHLTRQLQFKYQYMGSLLMDEDPGSSKPNLQNEYVLSVYKREIDQLKTDSIFADLKNLLQMYKEVSYANISRLAIGESPHALVGPILMR